MGVLGLWNLLEPVGKPVPVETLENKVLAVDISIWLNQAVKGFRDRSGNAVPHAHLLGLYNRVCKLLFYRIKPVFVFDGQPPQLKRDTLIRRRMRKSKDTRKAKAASAKILDNYLRSQAISQKLQRQTFAIEKISKQGAEGIHSLLSKRTAEKEKDIFELPELPPEAAFLSLAQDSESESETEDILENLGVDTSDIYHLDVHSEQFKSLPQELQYDVLSEMREKRKQNSWAQIHQMPSKAESFSSFQLDRLKHRRGIQKTMDSVKDNLRAGKEEVYSQELFVGDISGIKTLKKELKKVESNFGTTLLYASGLRSAKEREEREANLARKAREDERRRRRELLLEERELVDDPDDPAEEEEEVQLARAIALSLEDQGPSQSNMLSMIKEEPTSSSRMSTQATSSRMKSQPATTGIKQEPLEIEEEDYDDEIVLLPDASVFNSNRLGGQSNIKQEIKVETIDYEYQTDTNSKTKDEQKNIARERVQSKGVPLQCQSVPESTNRNSTEDLFADVFKTKEDHSALLEIFETVGKSKRGYNEVGAMSDTSSDTEEDAGPTVEVMSDSGSSESSEGSLLSIPSGEDLQTRSNEEEDIFSDIFRDQENIVQLDQILVDPRYKDPVMVDPGHKDPVRGNPGHKDPVRFDPGHKDPVRINPGHKAPARVDPCVSELLSKVDKLDKPGDIFSEISRSARLRREHQQDQDKFQTANKNCQTTSEDKEGMEVDGEECEEAEEIAAAMKNSSHLWMKIASKWAVDAASKSPKKGDKRASSAVDSVSKIQKTDSSLLKKDVLQVEQENLIKEMQTTEKESRLLRFTQINYNQRHTVEEEEEGRSDEDEDEDVEELRLLGIQAQDASKYSRQVLTQQGLLPSQEMARKDVGALAENISKEAEKTDAKAGQDNAGTPEPEKSKLDNSAKVGGENVIYSAAAPGFSRSSKDKLPVIDVSNGNTGYSGLEREDIDPDDPCDDPSSGENEKQWEAELYAIQAELAKENSSLVAEMNKADRVANSITDQMYTECQELLQLFGIPWIVSPTEAEAQCAWLDSVGLTNGTITDDSDIWLFGGTRVYKNFFNQEKYVEMFNYEEIAHHFGLNREKMILLAMLTGSDYTEGIEGVGPVTALEILAEFSGEGLEPLQEFKQWWDRVHKEYGKDFGMPVGNKVREKLRKYKLHPGFPSEAVMKAYTDPRVDESKEKFSWAVPNLVAVRDFAQERFGWSKFQIDEILKPVVRSLQRSSSQGRIDSYFSSYRLTLPDKGLQSSKRVEDALRRVKGISSPQKNSPKKVVKAAPKPKRLRDKTSSAADTNTSASGYGNRTVDASLPAAESGNKTAVSSPSTAGPSNSNVSIIAKSCGFVVSASPDDLILQREERERKAREVKARAAAIFKKSEEARMRKHKKRFKRPARIELNDHCLSSEED